MCSDKIGPAAKCEDLPKQKYMSKIKVTSKKQGIVYGSDLSGGVKVSLHGLNSNVYKAMRRGTIIKF